MPIECPKESSSRLPWPQSIPQVTRHTMARVKNILFIMCDQLRADHLSCYGHPRLHTPNLDALAASGVVTDRAVVPRST